MNFLSKDKLKDKLFKIKRILLIKDSVKPAELFSQIIKVLILITLMPQVGLEAQV